MNNSEWTRRNIDMLDRILLEEPQTQRERDIWNLKYILFNIGKDSLNYRIGCVSTLRRVIEALERMGTE